MQYPDNLKEFMHWYKHQSEQYFSTLKIDIEPLQTQQEIKWRPGLTEHELAVFQQELGFDFPEEIIEWYRTMNGTNLPVLHILDEGDDKYYPACFQFFYPEHLPKIKQLIQERLAISGLNPEQMSKESIPFIFPVGDYEFMVIDKIANPIYYLSIAHKNHDVNQVYIYGSLSADNLQSWLYKQTFQRTYFISDLQEFPDKARTTNYWTTEKE